MFRLQVLGGGRMGEALLAGLLSSGWASTAEVCVAERLAARRDELVERYPGLAVTAAPVAAEGVVIAVKPGDVAQACAAAVAAGPPSRVLSIAAGVPISAIEAALDDGTVAVVRAMPNTPALVGAGAAAIAAGSTADDATMAWAAEILGAVGTVARVDEAQLDAVTGLSGSGPAYVFLIAEALVEAGVLNGLGRDVATALTNQTLLGAARLLTESGRDPSGLRADVTSPGGTTAAGLLSLERAGVRAAFLDAVTAATDRSRSLGA